MSWFITNFVAAFLLPPLSLLLMLALGIFLHYRRHKFAKPLLLAAFGLLWYRLKLANPETYSNSQ